MPATVTAKYLGGPEKEKQFSALVADRFKDIQGDWRVTLLGDQKNTIWELKIDDPDGTRSGIKKFYGQDGELSVEAIMLYVNLITRDVPRARAAQQS
jgi:hypothetical protein